MKTDNIQIYSCSVIVAVGSLVFTSVPKKERKGHIPIEIQSHFRKKTSMKMTSFYGQEKKFGGRKSSLPFIAEVKPFKRICKTIGSLS